MGSFWVNVSVSDGNGNSDSDSTNVTVQQVVVAPPKQLYIANRLGL